MPAKKSTHPGPRTALRRSLGIRSRTRIRARPTSTTRYGLFIDGKFVAPKSKKYFDSICPRDGKKAFRNRRSRQHRRCRCRLSGRRHRLQVWTQAPRQRARASTSSASPACFRTARANSPSPKPSTAASRSRNPATSTCPMVAAHFFYHAGWADKLDYRRPRPHARIRSASSARSSPGISRCSCSHGKSPPPSPRGNTVVLKPAETTSITALKFAAILQEAGLPAGRRQYRHRCR